MFAGLNLCVSRQLLSRGMGDKSSSQEDHSDYEGRFAGGKPWSFYCEGEDDLIVTERKAVEEAPTSDQGSKVIPASLPLHTI